MYFIFLEFTEFSKNNYRRHDDSAYGAANVFIKRRDSMPLNFVSSYTPVERIKFFFLFELKSANLLRTRR